MRPRREIRGLERLEIALKGGPDAKRDWLLNLRQEMSELITEIDRELETLSPEAGNLGRRIDPSIGCAQSTVPASDVKLALQEAGHELARRFPDRAWSLFVWPAGIEQRASYVSNAARSKALQAMQELIDSGLPGLPADDHGAKELAKE